MKNGFELSLSWMELPSSEAMTTSMCMGPRTAVSLGKSCADWQASGFQPCHPRNTMPVSTKLTCENEFFHMGLVTQRMLCQSALRLRQLKEMLETRRRGQLFEPQISDDSWIFAHFGTIAEASSRTECPSCRDLAQEITRWEYEDHRTSGKECLIPPNSISKW